MYENVEDKNEILLGLQNALIRQKVDQEKLKNEINELEERSNFYENLYNSANRTLYDLEIECKKLMFDKKELEVQYNLTIEEKNTLKLQYDDLRSGKNNVHNLGSIELMKVPFIRFKKRFVRERHESN